MAKANESSDDVTMTAIIQSARKMMYTTLGDHLDRELVSAYLLAECSALAVSHTSFMSKAMAVSRMGCMEGIFDKDLLEALEACTGLYMHITHLLEDAVKGEGSAH